MFPKPVSVLTPNTFEYERLPLVKPTGFREYDARWLFGSELNLMGVQALGLGLATLLHEMGVKPRLATGHDFRSYSASIKHALICGLMAGGVEVVDIGLALSPMAYFAQFALDCPAVAMVTASHNDNGWTGVKMGAQRPVTFGPDEMAPAARYRAERPLPGALRRLLCLCRGFRQDLSRRSRQPHETQAQDEGRRGLRQRHGGRLRAGPAGASGLRGGPARRDAGL